jgi:hypothetical protein
MIGLETMTTLLQLGSEFMMIVDLSVKGDHKFAIRCAHWLMASGKIDDRQAPIS